MNTTTIEGWEKDKVAILKRRGKIREVRLFSRWIPFARSMLISCVQYKYPYHLGVVANVKSVLGENPLLWCWPQKVGGNGLRYTVAQDLGKSSDAEDLPRSRKRGKARVSDWEDVEDSV